MCPNVIVRLQIDLIVGLDGTRFDRLPKPAEQPALCGV